jgi:hypothetical protein
MQQQLLRSRRVATGIKVSQIMVPLSIKQRSVRLAWHGADRAGGMRLSFIYTGTAPCSLQVLWGMEQGAVKRLSDRLNRQDQRHGDRRSSFSGRRRKRVGLRGWFSDGFGAKYTALESRETGTYAGSEIPCLDAHLLGSGGDALSEGRGVGFGETTTTSRPAGLAIFAESDCCGMSEWFELPPGRDCVFEQEVWERSGGGAGGAPPRLAQLPHTRHAELYTCHAERPAAHRHRQPLTFEPDACHVGHVSEGGDGEEDGGGARPSTTTAHVLEGRMERKGRGVRGEGGALLDGQGREGVEVESREHVGGNRGSGGGGGGERERERLFPLVMLVRVDDVVVAMGREPDTRGCGEAREQVKHLVFVLPSPPSPRLVQVIACICSMHPCVQSRTYSACEHTRESLCV